MNRILKTGFGVILLILTSFISAKAQDNKEAYAMLTISAKNFPEFEIMNWSGLIKRGYVEFVSLSVSLVHLGDTTSLLSIYAGDLSTSNDKTVEVPFNKEDNLGEATLKFVIIFHHRHWWNVDQDYNEEKTYYSNSFNLNSAFSNSFATNDEEYASQKVSWSFNYRIEISPFKPIVSVADPQCYNKPFPLTLVPNAPLFYDNSESLYKWEYGVFTNEWIKTQEFTYFVNNISSSMSDRCQPSDNIDCYRIDTTIINTNYDFMVDHLNLYSDLSINKQGIAVLLLNGILAQNHSSLTGDEIDFLINNFIDVALLRYDFPIPYIFDSSVKNWETLATGKKSTDPIEFIPEDHPAVLHDKTKIGFRARAYVPASGRRTSDKYGPYSDPITTDILPAAPTASVSYDSSCVNSATAVITISKIESIDPDNFYYYNIGKEGDSSGVYYSFSGTYKKVEKLFLPGSYTLSLSYGNTDIRGCYSEYPITIGSLPELAYDVTQTDVTCPGLSDGSIRVNITNGAGSNYIINANGDTLKNTVDYTFSGLTAKPYTVKFGDFCVDTNTSIEILQPDTVVISNVTLTHPTCISNPNGGFKVEVSGLKSNKYNYYIYKASDLQNPWVTAEDKGSIWEIDTLPADSYIINVRDNDNPRCAGVSTTVKVLNSVDSLKLITNKITKVKCYGGNTGEIELTASGGSGYYKFNIGSEVLASYPATFSSLLAGNYTVSVRNGDETCKDVASAEVTMGTNPKIDISLIPVDVTCYGEENGQIRTAVSGGTNSFKSYDWEIKANGGWIPHTSSDPFPSGLYPGEYRLKVTDSDNCSVYDSTDINEPGLLYITSVKPNDIACYGEKGTIEIDAQGGNGEYYFSFYENGGASFENLPPNYLLPAGTYKLKVTDSKGCEARWQEKEVDKEVKITEPPTALVFSTDLSDFNGFNISCNGETNGSIAILASGGNGVSGSGVSYNGYNYSLSGGSDQSDSEFASLVAGTYNIRVTDKRGCHSVGTITLTQPDKLNMSPYSEPVKCFGEATGKLSATASGGVEPYLYQLNDMGFYSAPVFSGLYANTYTITVKDKNGCLQNLPATVEHKNQQIQTIIILQDVRCFGESNGKIAATVTGGSGSFDMLWEKKINDSRESEWESVANLERLGPGDYRFKVTDSDNCSVSDSIMIKEPDLLTISKINLHDIICYGETGKIDIETEGGNEGHKFFYSENNGITYTEFTSGSPLKAATYKLKVTDSKGCETAWSDNMTITNPPEALGLTWFAKDYNGYNVSCYGNNNGLISVTPSGGNGVGYKGYSYLLSGRSSQTDSVFANLTAGPYNISLTDARGCTISKQVKLTEAISELFLGASSLEQATCIDDANGRITLTASGGSSPYTYASGDNAFVSENEFTNLRVSNYHFMVKDVNGCTQTFYTSIVNTVPKMDITGIITDAKCFGQNSGRINVNISGGAMPFTYRWKENSSTNPFIDNLYKGNYTLSVTDAAGCKAEQLFEIHEPVLPLSVTAISQAACALTPNGTIMPAGLGGTPPYLYAVDDQSHMYNTSLFLAYSGRHKVFAADANNCLAETEVTINERNKMPFVNFMLATSRYERDTLVVIDVSVPKPDDVTWEFSPEATVIATNPFDAKIKYNVTGIYPVKMTGHFETCDYTVEKLLNIAPYDPLLTGKDKYLTGIESVQISPNPNDGQFKVKVKLYTKQQIHIKVLDFYSKIWHSSRYPAGIEFEQDISIPGVLPGTYVLWIVSDNDSRALLFIISQ